MRWLEGDMGAAQFMAQTESHAYGGCNLVLGDFQRGSWVWLTNKAIASDDQAASPVSSSVWRSRMLEPGIMGSPMRRWIHPGPKPVYLRKP